MDELTEQARRAVSAVEEAVKSEGWSVETSIVGTSVRIALDHPLSTPHSINFPNDDHSHLDFINEALSQREFATIAEPPVPVEHTELLKSLRAGATANMWDSATLETVARLLEANGLLTEDESRWLEQAGRTWEE